MHVISRVRYRTKASLGYLNSIHVYLDSNSVQLDIDTRKQARSKVKPSKSTPSLIASALKGEQPNSSASLEVRQKQW